MVIYSIVYRDTFVYLEIYNNANLLRLAVLFICFCSTTWRWSRLLGKYGYMECKIKISSHM